ncbi:hypothetical protein [Burkholderia perseverans]|uniref:hypothetical protein n=1 Tax=Burkholderia perseverans TaxID=2615214 RepID=UPI001FED919D|nr:hypothetical protein [Burkholderia perseverans]
MKSNTTAGVTVSAIYKRCRKRVLPHPTRIVSRSALPCEGSRLHGASRPDEARFSRNRSGKKRLSGEWNPESLPTIPEANTCSAFHQHFPTELSRLDEFAVGTTYAEDRRHDVTDLPGIRVAAFDDRPEDACGACSR